MKIVLTDYSEVYYSTVAKTGVPEKWSGKFVQIRNDDTEYLVISPQELTPYHADLVERFCLENDISGTLDPAKKRYDIHDPSWTVAGGGKFEIDKTNKSIRLYDNSMAYGRFESRGLREKVRRIAQFSDFEIMIE